MIEGPWWLWALTLVVVALIAPVLNLMLDNWWAKRKNTQKVLTEDAFRKLFNESILPDLERNLTNMIETQIRAQVGTRYLGVPDSSVHGEHS